MGGPGTPGSKEGQEPMLSEQWRKRWMGAKEDEQIEIGPLIGRGGYGKVFKGAAHALCVDCHHRDCHHDSKKSG